jgi:hypothetical protein
MSEIKVKIGQKEYTLVCTTAAYVEICEKYGGIEEMAATFQGEPITEYDTPEIQEQKRVAAARAANNTFSVIPWLVSVLANQGTMLALGKTRLTEDEKLWEETVLVQTNPKQIKDLTAAAMEAISIGFGMEHKQPEGNSLLDEVERQERKNAESAAE